MGASADARSGVLCSQSCGELSEAAERSCPSFCQRNEQVQRFADGAFVFSADLHHEVWLGKYLRQKTRATAAPDGAESLAGARAVFDITAAQPRRLFAQNHGGQD